MSGLLSADGRPMQALNQPKPLVGQELVKELTRIGGEDNWVLHAIDTWCTAENQLTTAVQNEQSVFQLVGFPNVGRIPQFEDDGSIAIRSVWAVHLQMIAKSDAESALQQQPRWMRAAQGFIGVQLDEAGVNVVGLTGFYGQILHAFSRPLSELDAAAINNIEPAAV